MDFLFIDSSKEKNLFFIVNDDVLKGSLERRKYHGQKGFKQRNRKFLVSGSRKVSNRATQKLDRRTAIKKG